MDETIVEDENTTGLDETTAIGTTREGGMLETIGVCVIALTSADAFAETTPRVAVATLD